ncbi:hypothetical protein PRIPAC_90596 [Pristionchus pacificus]|uniref:G protein-coupled receptor n=1 Tax=Pristionchus pacificus TaxID=54126 RepID=A0A2A6B6X7_PRIPA|nr:hypothetical protein PRIPAC_90596 [Pristionchus pacificus]|eukprot:PDM61632.1 G protein-coupled receptor [Pristionchus pacificus]
MEAFLDVLNDAFPTIHTVIFAIGVVSNGGLIAASLKRTPRSLQAYAIMITIGACNDLVSVCTDFFTQQR